MAMDFSLEVDTTLTPGQVTELISEIAGFQKDSVDECYFAAAGLSGGVRSLDNISQEILKEEVGIFANIRVWYRLDQSEYETGMRNGLHAFTTVLQRETNGDAVVRLNGDDVKMLRKGGKLILNSTSFSNESDAVWRFTDIPFTDYEIKNL